MNIHDLPLARDEEGFPREITFTDRAFSVVFRLYEPIADDSGDETIYTHVIDLDVSNEKDARDWMYAYTIRILVSDHGDHRRDPVLKKQFRDYADWVVANSRYEVVKNTKDFDFMRITFTDNPPEHLVIA